MAAPSISLDKREPRGIIIRAGSPKPAGMPFWAYFWSDEIAPASCAAMEKGRILESDPASEGLSPACRASP
jgi:hypothetical protein